MNTTNVAHTRLLLPLPSWLAWLTGNGREPPSRRLAPPNRIVHGLPYPKGRRSVVTLEGRPGRTLGEESFLWFLANERARAARSGRPLGLLLVSLQLGARQAVQIEPAAAARLFAALRGAARETDVVGWYREGRVAGVLLSEDANGLEPDACSRILLRVTGALQQRLPSSVARELRLRALRVLPKPGTDVGRLREPLRVAEARYRQDSRELRKLG